MSIPEPVMRAASSAPAVVPELLNSERIKASFGSYGIEILSEANGLRRANLYSEDGGRRTCRTYAVVRSNEVPEAIAMPHAAIVDGHSIGATFREHGWTVAKRTIATAAADLGAIDPDVARLMRLDSADSVAVHVYELVISRDAQTIGYATITELHHPLYLDAPALDRLFPGDSTISPGTLHELLKVFGLSN